ncbi:MAG: hypothetical protein QOG68_1734 [Solirubrobacteraceae bacterium]|jgi:hypothetical protein|nr:hypothetical protein [Solirubrobacteraceae bacterium]
MHPARHRALRELGAFTRQMSDHWAALAERVGDGPVPKALREGAAAAGTVLEALKPLASARDVEIGPAAMNAGRFARARPLVPDAVLERNQAVRFALLDAELLLTLISYLGALSASDGDQELVDACARWKAAIGKPARAARRGAIALGTTPDKALEPISKGQKLTWAIGWLGEATDRRTKRS